jgi:hypothetical protein
MFDAAGMRETTVGDTILSVFMLAIKHNWTYSATSGALDLIASTMAQPGIQIPASFSAALRLIAPYSVACRRLNACTCDSTIISDIQQICKACGHDGGNQNCAPGRAFYFCPLHSLLQNIFADPQKAALIRACSGPIRRVDNRIANFWGRYSHILSQHY